MPDDPIAPPPPLPTPPSEVSVPYLQPAAAPEEPRNKVVAISLALGLGGIGAHGFYLGNKAMGTTLALMCVGGAGLAILLFLASLAGTVSVWMTAFGLVPMLTAMTVPYFQAARYGAAKPEQFHQRYVVEKRWF
ncbi:MAG: hypothetical protein JWN14_4974 [Chthonomonadales bacterium]|nr:hypothetical protein [Chthonomonadales bacterium]